MSVLTVGRANPITGTVNFNAQGDRLRISGLIAESDVTLAKAVRQQILGYDGNPDETVFPITNDVDPTIDGFYSMLSGSVDVGRGNLKIGHLPFTLDLVRVPGYAKPLIEPVLLGALRTNNKSVASGTEVTWHAAPGAATLYADGGVGAARADRTADDGSLLWFYKAASGVSYHNARPRFIVSPASYYQGRARLEVGAVLREVVGRQIQNLPGNWRLSNGLVRIVPNGVTFDLSFFNGSAWSAVKNFQLAIDDTLGAYSGGGIIPLTGPSTITVLRNSPEGTVIRLTFSALTYNILGDITLDIGLRRGDRLARCYATIGTSLAAGALLTFGTTTSSTATLLTGSIGYRATNNDANNNRWVLAGENNGGGGSGQIHHNGANPPKFPFAVGAEIGGTAATGQEAALQLVYQYMAADTETQMIVGR